MDEAMTTDDTERARQVARGLSEGQKAVLTTIDWIDWTPPPNRTPIFVVQAPADEWSGQPMLYMEDARDFPPGIFAQDGRTFVFTEFGRLVAAELEKERADGE